MLFGIQTDFGMGKSIGIYPFLKLWDIRHFQDILGLIGA